MHWFWRGAIAAVIGLTLMTCQVHASWFAGSAQEGMEDAVRFLSMNAGIQTVRFSLATAIVFHLPGLLFSFLIYGVLTRYLGSRRFIDPELRCRKCHYILKGITEPRCPECEERI